MTTRPNLNLYKKTHMSILLLIGFGFLRNIQHK